MRRILVLLPLLPLLCAADKGVETRKPGPESKPAAEVRPAVPPIGHALGVRVGADSIEKLEKLHGRGQACLGDGPRGGRVWKLDSWLVYANGLQVGQAGTVITELVMGDPDEVVFPADSRKSRTPPSLSGRKKSIFGGLYPGITRPAASQLLAGKKWTVSKEGEDLMLRMGGLSKVGKDAKFSDWEARLVFHKDRLVQVAIRCWQAK